VQISHDPSQRLGTMHRIRFHRGYCIGIADLFAT
jgi:hypothetical protein